MFYKSSLEDLAAEFGITWDLARLFTGSQFHVERAKRWIHECQETHDCDSSSYFPEGVERWSKDRLPRRLVYIGTESENPRIVEVYEEKPIAFAAFSHCWGPQGLPVEAKTLIATLKEREMSIPIHTLPRSFREAIVFSRRLGLDYIWIDALCIVQDSQKDWSRESVKMGAVYENAAVTIADESSEDAHGGLFDICEPDSVTIPTTLSDGRCITLVFYATDSGSLYSKRTCLAKRAWAMQERVSSTRVLHFFDAGILWECRKHFNIWDKPSANAPQGCIDQTGPQYGKELSSSHERFVNYQKEQVLMEMWGSHTLERLMEVRTELVPAWTDEVPRWILFRPWFYTFIPAYSYRKLTFSSDKCIAISSLARKFQQ